MSAQKTARKRTKKTAQNTAAGKAKAGAKPVSEAQPKKLSALDAAARVLAAFKVPMTTKEMIEAMAAKGLWASPGGKTPHATLFSALTREITTKGKQARVKKTERGKFSVA